MISDDIRLGRIAGIPLAMNWSVLVIVWLLTWSLAANVLPETVDGYSDTAYWIAGLVGAVMFFVSLLAHELSHAVVARRAGINVEGMTLWLFGGVAKLGGQPRNARDDLRIAAVGPATSIGLSLGFAVLATALAWAGAPDIMVGVIAWLAAINLILAVFNLIPGAPLDGGRILRALLWLRHGSWMRAAVSATRAGQWVGYGLIWLGLAQFLVFAGIGGLWTVFIGWFILAASRAEREHVVAEVALRGLRVRDVMTPNPQTAPAQITVADLVDHYILARPHSAYPVEEPDGQITGLVTLNQLRQVPPDERHTKTVKDVAVPRDDVQWAKPDQTLVPLLPHMGNDASRMLIFDKGRLAGILTSTDIARAVHARTLDDLPPGPPDETQS